MHLWFIFCRKIGLFTCKSNVIIKEYEKKSWPGDTRMALKEMYILQKAYKNTQKHRCMYESDSVLVKPLVLLSHPSWVTIRNM